MSSDTRCYISDGYIYGPRESGKFHVHDSGDYDYSYAPGESGRFHIQYSGDYGYIYGPGESGMVRAPRAYHADKYSRRMRFTMSADYWT